MEAELDRIGLWGIIVVYTLREFVIPSLNKIIPSHVKKGEREQDREDKKLEFEQQMELRHVEALEEIRNVLVGMDKRMDARLSKIENELSKKKPRKRN